MRGIDYVVEECPNAVGATQLVYKDALNRLEAASPGTKLAFVQRVPAHRRSRPSRPRAERRAPPGDLRSAAACRRAASVCALLPAGRARSRRKRARRAARRAGGVSDDRRADDGGGARSLLRDREPVVLHRPQGARRTCARCKRGRPHERARRAVACDDAHRPSGGLDVATARGERLLVLRPTYAQLIPSLPRQAQPIYPKDVGPMLLWGDIAPGHARHRGRRRSRRAHARPAARRRPDRARSSRTSCARTSPHARATTSRASTAPAPNWTLRVARRVRRASSSATSIAWSSTSPSRGAARSRRRGAAPRRRAHGVRADGAAGEAARRRAARARRLRARSRRSRRCCASGTCATAASVRSIAWSRTPASSIFARRLATPARGVQN